MALTLALLTSAAHAQTRRDLSPYADSLARENAVLHGLVVSLRQENQNLRTQLADLEDDTTKLGSRIVALRRSEQQARQLLQEMQSKYQTANHRIDELERQLALLQSQPQPSAATQPAISATDRAAEEYNLLYTVRIAGHERYATARFYRSMDHEGHAMLRLLDAQGTGYGPFYGHCSQHPTVGLIFTIPGPDVQFLAPTPTAEPSLTIQDASYRIKVQQ